jgi:hypothetical protein
MRENEPEGFEWREALEEHMDNRYAGIQMPAGKEEMSSSLVNSKDGSVVWISDVRVKQKVGGVVPKRHEGAE